MISRRACQQLAKAMQLATVHLPAALFQVLWQGKTSLDRTFSATVAAAAAALTCCCYYYHH